MAYSDPTKQARLYGWRHQVERKRWAPVVERGEAICWRCRRLIPSGSPWDLGHDDRDSTHYAGPEHRRCNRAAGQATTTKLAAKKRATRRLSGKDSRIYWSRQWL